MGLIRVRDFAKEVGCSTQNIYKHIRNYKEELGGHLVQNHHATFLDEEAQDFIRGVMYPKELDIQASGVLVELNELRAEHMRLGAAHAELATKLARTEGERDRALLEAGQYQKALAASQEAEEARATELQQAHEDYRQASEALEKMRDEAHMRLQEAEAAQAREDELRVQLDAEKAKNAALVNRGLFARIFNKGVD